MSLLRSLSCPSSPPSSRFSPPRSPSLSRISTSHYLSLALSHLLSQSRATRAPSRELTSTFRDFPFGTVFDYSHDGGYIVRLHGIVEKSGGAWVACISRDGVLESFQANSLLYLASLPLSGVGLPFLVQKAVTALIDNPSSYFRYNRAPRRPPRSLTAPSSPLRLHPRLQPLQSLLGPLSCPIPPSPPLSAIFSLAPGFPAPPAQLALLQQWGIYDVPEAQHPTACVIFSAVESAVHGHRSRSGFLVSREEFAFSPDAASRLVHGVHDPCPCLWKSSSAHLIHLLTGTRISRAAEQALFGIPSDCPQGIYLNSLPGERFAHEMTCQGVAVHSSTTLVAPILRSKAMRRARGPHSHDPLNIVTNFSGIELFLVAFHVLGQDIRLRGACDQRKRLRHFYTEHYPDTDFQTDATVAASQDYECDLYVSGVIALSFLFVLSCFAPPP